MYIQRFKKEQLNLQIIILITLIIILNILITLITFLIYQRLKSTIVGLSK